MRPKSDSELRSTDDSIVMLLGADGANEFQRLLFL